MKSVPILMYHWFRPDDEPSRSRSPQLEITPELFAQHLRWLKEQGYRSMTLGDLIRKGRSRSNAEDGTVVITVDDGSLDFFTLGYPLMEEYGFTATIFIVTGHVGKESDWDRDIGEPPRPLMNWGHLRQLQRSGFEIGSHTHTHRNITKLVPDQVRKEFAHSRWLIEKQLGMSPECVAYPGGRFSLVHKGLAREAGYRGACAVMLHWNDLFYEDRYSLRRVTAKGTEDLSGFARRLRWGHTFPLWKA